MAELVSADGWVSLEELNAGNWTIKFIRPWLEGGDQIVVIDDDELRGLYELIGWKLG